MRGIHRSPVNSPHKGQWRGALMFPSICAWINGWLNNDGAGGLRRHRAHYAVTVMGRELLSWVMGSLLSNFAMENYIKWNWNKIQLFRKQNKPAKMRPCLCRSQCVKIRPLTPSSPFCSHGVILICNCIHHNLWDETIIKHGTKLLIHYQTSTAAPMKFGKGWVISSHTLLGMWLLLHAGI